MSLIGKEISEFKVQAYRNGAFQEISKRDVLGKWSVFFFYPADFTFVCPTELADLADKYEEFQDAGCEIYSVSCDTHYVHKAWHDASETIQKIHYPMLADPTGSVTLVQHYPKTTPVIFWSLSILISLMTERQSVRFSSRVKFS